MEEKHEHIVYPSEVFRLANYEFCIIILRCSNEKCDWETWDYSEPIEEEKK